MFIGVLKERAEGETRVALSPDAVRTLKKKNLDVLVESGAGKFAFFSDKDYEDAGATIIENTSELVVSVSVLAKVNAPETNIIQMMKHGAVLIGFLNPAANKELLQQLAAKQVTAFAMELMPRVSRAQSMDALSSQANIAGYKAVLLAAEKLPKFFPMLTTAAGTIRPSKVFVIGAGVAGLQAIATAKRLGAIVSATDIRPEVDDQIRSLGATPIPTPEVASHIATIDALITTALTLGKKAPVLVAESVLRTMQPGSVIVDLAAEQGGNVEGTIAGETITKHGVTLLGPVNLAASMPLDASKLYAKNIVSFIEHLAPNGELMIDFNDEITASACVTYEGKLR